MTIKLETYLRSSLGGLKIRILDSGSGGRRWQNITEILSDFSEGEITYLERNEARAYMAKNKLGERIRIVNNKIEWFGTNQNFDLIYHDILPRDIPIFFTTILPCIKTLMADSGMLILNCPISDEHHDAISNDEKIFNKYSGRLGLGYAGIFHEKLAKSGFLLESDNPIIANNIPVVNFSYKTFALKLNEKTANLVGFSSDEKPEHFRIDDLMTFLSRMRGSVTFCLVKEFINALKKDKHKCTGFAAHCIKHDIHHDLLSAYRIAKGEALLGIPATFFIMHPHKLNQNYIKLPETIDVLKEIQSMGHQIGIHVDVYDLEINRSGVMGELSAFIEYLKSHGLNISTANAHGNTEKRSDNHVLENSIFPEIAKLRGRQIHMNEKINNTSSLRNISEKLGINIWFDTVIFDGGSPVSGNRLMVGDNYHKFDLYDLFRGENFDSSLLLSGGWWHLDDSLQQKLHDKIKNFFCVYLIHPQFYK